MQKSETGKIVGSIEVDEPLVLSGMVTGNVRVVRGGRLTLNGMACSGVTVEEGAWAMLNGTVKGGVVNNGGEISITGTVHGVVDKKAGTTVIQSCAVIKP